VAKRDSRTALDPCSCMPQPNMTGSPNYFGRYRHPSARRPVRACRNKKGIQLPANRVRPNTSAPFAWTPKPLNSGLKRLTNNVVAPDSP
jgi:hypothetical protein